CREVRFARDGGHLSSFEIRSGAATSDRSSQVTSVWRAAKFGSAEVLRCRCLQFLELIRGGAPVRFEGARFPAGESRTGFVRGLQEREQRSARVGRGADRLVGEDRQRSAAGFDPVSGGQRLVTYSARFGAGVRVVGGVGDVVV